MMNLPKVFIVVLNKNSGFHKKTVILPIFLAPVFLGRCDKR